MRLTDTWGDPRKVQRLRQHWAEGASTAEIGRMLGVSKNSVISKARRVGLPGRRNPVASPDRAKPAPVKVVAPPPVKPAPAPVVAKHERIEACCWVTAQEGKRSWRYCDAVSLPNQPYCAEHAAMARPAVKRRIEDAELVAGGEG
jgi:GcrA cell cycle regulator